MNTKEITVIRKRSWFAKIFGHIMFWATLIAAAGTSRLLFGGSWVIDVLILVITLVVVVMLAREMSGYSVDLTNEQIAAWVAAGQPDDIKAWRDRTYPD